jgi:hypothetical protein
MTGPRPALALFAFLAAPGSMIVPVELLGFRVE